jgi:nucleoside-diphosphate-sugar epimerase
LDRFPDAEVELFSGNLTNVQDCYRAAEDVALLIQCAAGLGGGLVNMFVDSVISSRNLLNAIVEHRKIKRIVQISSFAVYEAATLKRCMPLTEETLLESHHELRIDAYAYTKHKQELLFWKYSEDHELPLVVLRPGVVFGPYGPEISSRVGIDPFGLFLHIGGNNKIPLTYVDNCAEAIVLAATRPGIEGQIFNIHDDDLLTNRAFLKQYKRAKGNIQSIRIPYYMIQVLSRLAKWYSEYSRGQIPLVFTPYRTAAIWKGVRFDNAKAKQLLGWLPRVPMAQALKTHFSFIRSKSSL